MRFLSVGVRCISLAQWTGWNRHRGRYRAFSREAAARCRGPANPARPLRGCSFLGCLCLYRGCGNVTPTVIATNAFSGSIEDLCFKYLKPHRLKKIRWLWKGSHIEKVLSHLILVSPHKYSTVRLRGANSLGAFTSPPKVSPLKTSLLPFPSLTI